MLLASDARSDARPSTLSTNSVTRPPALEHLLAEADDGGRSAAPIDTRPRRLSSPPLGPPFSQSEDSPMSQLGAVHINVPSLKLSTVSNSRRRSGPEGPARGSISVVVDPAAMIRLTVGVGRED